MGLSSRKIWYAFGVMVEWVDQGTGGSLDEKSFL